MQATVNGLKAKAKRAVADGKIMAYGELADAKLDALKCKLKEPGNASGDAWQEMKGGIGKTWDDLTECCGKAARCLNDER